MAALSAGELGAKPTGAPSRIHMLRDRHPWLDHVVRAAKRYTDHHGDHYAAAVTFFSVLSLVPLLMIAFGVAGYVLFFNPALLEQLRLAITSAVPGNLANTLNASNAAGAARCGVRCNGRNRV